MRLILGTITAGMLLVGAYDPPPIIHLRASTVSAAAMQEIVPLCGKTIGAEVRNDYANNPIVKKAIEDGAAFDVVVLETHMVAELAGKGLVTGTASRELASIGMGMIAKAGEPVPSIETEEAFRQALLEARSIGYAADGHSGALFLQVIEQMGLKEALGSRLVPLTGKAGPADVLSGKIQYAVAPFAGELPAPFQMVGRFPASLGADVALSASLSPKAAAGARAFLDCLGSAQAKAVFAAKGYRPLR